MVSRQYVIELNFSYSYSAKFKSVLRCPGNGVLNFYYIILGLQ